ncbi:MAG: phosphoribosylformylglycinamidine synthase subunit PurQ [Campylobacter sp.]|nr:phosphoribosylformylglycinamidine synthase subunit PurQ [Campylobacter sp.]
MKIAILNFPGTSSLEETKFALDDLGYKSEILWHKQDKVDADLVILPSGASYGNYLRPAAIAKHSPIINSLLDHAKKGGYIVGISDGFQLLLELGLLPGATNQNINLKCISKFQHFKVASNSNKLLSRCKVGEVLNMPISSAYANYYLDSSILPKIWDKEQVLLTYCDAFGNDNNPNGSVDNIAGVCDENKKIFGFMPQPQRANDEILGSSDGIKILKGFL